MNLVLDSQKEKQLPPVLNRNVPDTEKWTFSFRFWEQIKYFGLGGNEAKWFVSLLERLKELSKKEISKFLSDGSERSAWRYHDINWNQTNIPINRANLNWIDEVYLSNDEEYPIVQFQISQALGRIVGFFDERQVFNIVLLDSLHNIQPSKSYGYKVDDTCELSCEYTSLQIKLENIICKIPDQDIQTQIQALLTQKIYKNTIIHYLDPDDNATFNEHIANGTISSAEEVFSYGLMALSDTPK